MSHLRTVPLAPLATSECGMSCQAKCLSSLKMVSMRMLHQSVLHKDGSVEHPQTQALQCMSTSKHLAGWLVWSAGA